MSIAAYISIVSPSCLCILGSMEAPRLIPRLLLLIGELWATPQKQAVSPGHSGFWGIQGLYGVGFRMFIRDYKRVSHGLGSEAWLYISTLARQYSTQKEIQRVGSRRQPGKRCCKRTAIAWAWSSYEMWELL